MRWPSVEQHSGQRDHYTWWLALLAALTALLGIAASQYA